MQSKTFFRNNCNERQLFKNHFQMVSTVTNFVHETNQKSDEAITQIGSFHL